MKNLHVAAMTCRGASYGLSKAIACALLRSACCFPMVALVLEDASSNEVIKANLLTSDLKKVAWHVKCCDRSMCEAKKNMSSTEFPGLKTYWQSTPGTGAMSIMRMCTVAASRRGFSK